MNTSLSNTSATQPQSVTKRSVWLLNKSTKRRWSKRLSRKWTEQTTSLSGLAIPSLAIPYAIHRCLKGAGTADLALIYLTLAFSDSYKGKMVEMYKPFGDFVKDVKKDLNGMY